MAVNRQKLKLLYLMRMLEEETDSEQGLTMAQILEKLEEQGISAERKSIYRDIEALREFGVDVRTYQRAPVEYAVEHRDFAFPELLLLVDAVQSSRFLTQRKSDALVEGVKRLASKRQRALLDKRVHVEGRIKMQNESVFYSVDRIQEAIARKRMISFLYFKYDAAKRKKPQHDGGRYLETPVQLVYSDGYYYLVTFNEKHDDFATYRVDRMDRIMMMNEPALRNERIATFDTRELESRAFGMYRGRSRLGDVARERGGDGCCNRPFRQGGRFRSGGRRRGACPRRRHEKSCVLRVARPVRKSRPCREADLARARVPRLPRRYRDGVRMSVPAFFGVDEASDGVRQRPDATRLARVCTRGQRASDGDAPSIIEGCFELYNKLAFVCVQHEVFCPPADRVRTRAEASPSQVRWLLGLR